MMLEQISEKTVGLRHFVVRHLAPKVYEGGASIPRAMTIFLRNRFGTRELTGAEIGVAQGKNARNILELLNISRLYLVDPYLPYAEIKGNVLKTLDPRTFRQSALKTLKPFSDRIEFICETSEDAVDLVANNLDFVYIDGNHSYEFVRKDIENYYPKLNSDGIIGGHDFCPMYFGVCKAVVESAEKYDVQLWGNNGDWFFIS